MSVYTAGTRIRNPGTGGAGTVLAIVAPPTGKRRPGPWYRIGWDGHGETTTHHDDVERADR